MLKTCLRILVGLLGFFISLFLWFVPDFFLRLTGLRVRNYGYITVIAAAIYIAASFFTVYLLQTRIEKRPMLELGLQTPGKEMGKNLGLGILMGGILFAVAPLLQWLWGSIDFHGKLWMIRSDANALWLVPAAGLCKCLAVGFGEEIFFRGYLLRTVLNRHGVRAAVATSSLLFSLVHFVNPGYAPLVFVNILLVGVVLALAVLHHQSLWPAVGFHLAWNWVQIYVLQVMNDPQQLTEGIWVFAQRAKSPVFLSGGTYGSEATVFVTAIALGLLALYIWRIKKARNLPQAAPGRTAGMNGHEA